ncbi:hypothetical protein FQA47_007596 [Oryzias melastigma]|uniref:Uncharacterized protein n=1 Tax=Oryzias melastigma TaxID=30732 RepID=A0A834BXX5_ORYME|nr:hypothetical protein FQA47_007596 [Oryzias melastigma]
MDVSRCCCERSSSEDSRDVHAGSSWITQTKGGLPLSSTLTRPRRNRGAINGHPRLTLCLHSHSSPPPLSEAAACVERDTGCNRRTLVWFLHMLRRTPGEASPGAAC